MRHGGGFGAVVVTGQAQHAAVFRRARGIAVAEYVAAAVDAGALAVPDADHAIVAGALRQIELLRAPDRGGREILVHAGLELDVVLLEMFARGEQLLVVAAERRTPVARHEPRGIETCGAVAADLRHRQANQRLNPGHEDVAGALGVFLIETDRTLVDSHSTLLTEPSGSLAAPAFLASHSTQLRTSLCRFSRPAHHKSRHWSPAPEIAISCRNRRRRFRFVSPGALRANDVTLLPCNRHAAQGLTRQRDRRDAADSRSAAHCAAPRAGVRSRYRRSSLKTNFGISHL